MLSVIIGLMNKEIKKSESMVEALRQIKDGTPSDITNAQKASILFIFYHEIYRFMH